MAGRNRPDKDGWAKAAYQRAKKIIYASQSVCAICGRPVNFDLVFPDPWSPTLDHIVPIAKGGDPADINNLQLAHLQCNRRKAAKVSLTAVKPAKISNRDLPLSLDWTTYKGA